MNTPTIRSKWTFFSVKLSTICSKLPATKLSKLSFYDSFKYSPPKILFSQEKIHMQVFLFYLFPPPKKLLEGIGYWKVLLLWLLLGFQFHLCAVFQLQEKQKSGTWCKLLASAGYSGGSRKNEMKQKQAVHYYVLSVIHVLSNMTVIIITVYYSTEWVLHKSLEGVLFESDQLQTTGTPGGAVNMS